MGTLPRGAIARGLREPGRAIKVVRELLRGRICLWWCRLRGLRVEGGRGLRIEGRLIIRGPGRVILGDGVQVGMIVTPWTYHPDAVISIGAGSFLNGTRFGCQERIEVGAKAILASAQILDTDFHSTHTDRHSPEAPVRTASVIIEENVWVAASTGVLPGTRIGRNSVVGFGAVCNGDYPANVIIAGNPARVVGPIPGAVRAGE
jgi:acetyltransferase-like isoleucine patch superfamily enzyme